MGLIVVAIPAYNEEKTIGRIVLQSQRYAERVIVVDDGSTDFTGEIAKRLGAEVLRHESNLGKGEALRTFFKEAAKFKPDVVVTLDADGQHDPNEIPKLIHPILKGKADIVVGSRYVKGAFTDAPLYRKIGLRVINYFSRKMHKLPIGDTQSGFRAYSKRALSVVRLCESKGYGVELEQLALIDKEGGKLKIVEVPISVRYKGLEKTSKKHPLRHASELVTVILGLVVERRPLLFLGVPGALLTVLGIVLATYLLWLFNSMRYFSIPIAIVSLGALIVGLLLTITALTLHALTRLRSKFR